jgi:hypothetical protein
MSRKVIILGLYRPGVPPKEELLDCEIWTLNDWYMKFPWMVSPKRVYQLHYNIESLDRIDNRFENWRYHYNKAIEGGTKIYVVRTHQDIHKYGQVYFPSSILRSAPNYYRSIELMMEHAIDEYVGEISLFGVRLKPCEYKYHCKGMIETIEKARKIGIIVNNPYEEEWKEDTEYVDWSAINEDVPYWAGARFGSREAALNEILNFPR